MNKMDGLVSVLYSSVEKSLLTNSTMEGDPRLSFRDLFSVLSFSRFLLEDEGMKVTNFHSLQSKSSDKRIKYSLQNINMPYSET